MVEIETAAAPDSLLDVTELDVRFRVKRKGVLHAVKSVDLSLKNRRTMALVGESGSGKSTLARAIMQLVPLSAGKVRFDGFQLEELRGGQLRAARRGMQMVFQDPYRSLNGRVSIATALNEPLRFQTDLPRRDRDARARELLDSVGLPARVIDSYPRELSGGQRQRVGIARAIAADPALVIADEAVSALDVSTQNQILELFRRLQSEYGLAYLFISHDLAVVRHMADDVAIMYLGHIVEKGPTASVYKAPKHPYTEALLSGAMLGQETERPRIVLRGEQPDPLTPPKGCAFSTRCPYVMPVCREVEPALRQQEDGTAVACHLFE